MRQISIRNLVTSDPFADGIVRAFQDGGAARVEVFAQFLPDRCTSEVRVTVSDMVPMFQRQTVTICEDVTLHRGLRAAMKPLSDALKTVEAEREVRRWSQVDL